MEHDSVLDPVNDIREDKVFLEALTKKFGAKDLIKRLVAIRACQGYSERQFAMKLGWSDAYIFRIESSEDRDVQLGTLESYANALGFKLEVTLTPKES